MKKLLYAVLCVMAFQLCSCSQVMDSEENPGDPVAKKGTIVLKSNFDGGNQAILRTVSQKDLFVILEGPEERTIQYPESGIIEDLKAGRYKITVTTHPDEFTPAFEKPHYQGLENIDIKPAESTSVSITCSQVNAGIYFEYDPSLEDYGCEDIVPVVKQGEQALTFSGDNRDATGYFQPGRLEVSFTLAGQPVSLDGSEYKAIDLTAKQVCKFVVKCAPLSGSHDMGLIMQFLSMD